MLKRTGPPQSCARAPRIGGRSCSSCAIKSMQPDNHHCAVFGYFSSLRDPSAINQCGLETHESHPGLRDPRPSTAAAATRLDPRLAAAYPCPGKREQHAVAAASPAARARLLDRTPKRFDEG